MGCLHLWVTARWVRSDEVVARHQDIITEHLHADRDHQIPDTERLHTFADHISTSRRPALVFGPELDRAGIWDAAVAPAKNLSAAIYGTRCFKAHTPHLARRPGAAPAPPITRSSRTTSPSSTEGHVP